MKKAYFEITIYELQSLAKWSSDYARRALPIYEKFDPADDRPRNAVDAAANFALGGGRTNALRKIAMEAFRASSSSSAPIAAFAARSASFAAASAFTHPFADTNQARHILGAAVCSAMAFELAAGCDPNVGQIQIASAAEAAPDAVLSLLAKMPSQTDGRTRLDELYVLLDLALRRRHLGLVSEL